MFIKNKKDVTAVGGLNKSYWKLTSCTRNCVPLTFSLDVRRQVSSEQRWEEI